jgi:DNA-binding transcriptional ArsR family regulator
MSLKKCDVGPCEGAGILARGVCYRHRVMVRLSCTVDVVPSYLSNRLTVTGRATILKHVLNNVLDPELDLDRVFHALADPGRRRMLERLSQGPASVSELAKPLSMSLAAVLQHVQILEGSGLVQSRKLGRTRTCSLNAQTLRSAEHWISERRTFVERRLDRLGQYLADTADQEEDP